MRTREIALASSVLLAATVAAAPAEEKPERPTPEDVSALLAKVHAEAGVPALGGAVVTSQGLVAIGVAGKRAQGGTEDVTKDDLWHLGSCTKTMTATLLARLHEREVLTLDTTLEDAFPKLAKSMNAKWRDVPLTWLLQNRGGAPGSLMTQYPELWGRLRAMNKNPVRARDALTDEVLSAEPESEPGTHYEYSNAGFTIAGHAAEVRLADAWEDLLRKEVLTPLGMKSAGFGAPGSKKKRDQPFGHRVIGTDVIPVMPGPLGDNPAAIGPSATVHASLADWAEFVRLHLRGARGEEGLLLEPETFATLHTPPDGQEYAMGWIVTTRPWAKGEDGTGRVLWHNGSNTMWFCVVWMAPEKDFAVLATCNVGGTGGQKACDDVASALIRHHLRK